MNKEQFLKKYGITEAQFNGEEIECYIDLRSCTTLPEGITLTAGGGIDLSSCTTLPEGITLTAGGYIILKNSRKHIGEIVPKMNKNLFWKVAAKTYAKIDGIFCEILSEKKKENSAHRVFHAKKIGKDKTFYIVNNGNFYAHGDNIKSAFEDLEFKILSEKFKSEPINADTKLTVQHYRAITGACDLGCRQFLESNKIPYHIEGEGDSKKTVEDAPILAKDLLPLLKKTSAYGYERFAKLVTF